MNHESHLLADVINGSIRLILRLTLGEELATKAYQPVMKSLIALMILVVVALIAGVVYLAAR